jgi:LysW-gamma-L-lysine carboxypeptidase
MDEIALLDNLLRVYSPSHQESDAVGYLVSAMAEMGYDAGVDGAGNAVGRRGSGPNEVMLLGHIDTVAGFIDVHKEGDLLFGRGAVDAKGPLACFTSAGARLSPPPEWRITIVAAVGEESESHGARYLCTRYKPQALVIGEPSKWDHITLGFKGSLWLDYQVETSMAHTASGRESAPEAAVRFWNDLQAWCQSLYPTTSGPFNQLTPTLRGMSSQSDGFVESASVRIGLRLPPGLDMEELKNRLEELKRHGHVIMEEPLPAFKAEKNTPLVRAFLHAIRKAGGNPVFSYKTGTSDMNLVAPGWGCPSVAFGPGDSTLDHTPNEHISLEEYLCSIHVLEEALNKLFQLP